MRLVASGVLALLLASCVVYEPVPGPQLSTQQRFDRSWAAATGAMYDEGVTITSQDRGTGIIRGSKGADFIVATVQTLADGRIQVKFDSNGDPALVHGVSDSYDRRMGR